MIESVILNYLKLHINEGSNFLSGCMKIYLLFLLVLNWPRKTELNWEVCKYKKIPFNVRNCNWRIKALSSQSRIWRDYKRWESNQFCCRERLPPKSIKIYSCSSKGRDSACKAGDQGSITGFGSSSGEENGNPLQYSCLENSMDREAWQAIVHGVAKSWTWLSN